MSKQRLVGAIEIGTAKVVVAIGEITDGHSLSIIGVGESPSQGVKKGEIVDLQLASGAAHNAIVAAEKSAGVSLNEVYFSQTGALLDGFFNEAVVNVASSDNVVSPKDIERVTQEAKSKQLPPERVYIHHIQNPFKLDGRIVANPLGMEGRKLGVGYWSIHGDLKKMSESIHVINGFGLHVQDVIISSIASGSMIANETQKQNGVAILDIGRGTTDFVVYKDGYIIQTGVIPVGGDHLTNDLSLGLRIDTAKAEKLKLEYGKAIETETAEGTVEIQENGGTRKVTKKAITQILNARVEELFKLVRCEIENVIETKELTAGFFLTGGTSRLIGIDKLGTKVFGEETQLGDNPAWAVQQLREPEYSTVLGLLHYALRSSEKKQESRIKKNRLFSKFAKILNLN